MADSKSSAASIHVKAHFQHRNQIVQIRRVGFESVPTFEEFKQWLDQPLKEQEQQLKPTTAQHQHHGHHHHRGHHFHQQHPLFFLFGGHQQHQQHQHHAQKLQQQAQAEQQQYTLKHKLFYIDNEDERIQFGSELEWKEAVSLALKHNRGVIQLIVQIAFEPVPQQAKQQLVVEKKQEVPKALPVASSNEKPKTQPEHHQFRITIPQQVNYNCSPRQNRIRVISIRDEKPAPQVSTSPKETKPASPSKQATASAPVEAAQAQNVEEQNLSSSQLVDLVPVEKSKTFAEPIYPSVPVKQQDEKILDESWDYLEVKSDSHNISKQQPEATLFSAIPSAPAATSPEAVIVNIAEPTVVTSPKVAPVSASVEQEFTRELSVLESMGFSQKQLNLHLLKFHKGNLQNVVLALIDFNAHSK